MTTVSATSTNTRLPWTRATSVMTSWKRRAVSSPPWGPVPVTTVPATITASAATRSASPSAPRRQRRGGHRRDRRVSGAVVQDDRVGHQDDRQQEVALATRAGCRSNITVMPPSTIWPTTPATSPSDSQREVLAPRCREPGIRARPRSRATTTTPVNMRFRTRSCWWNDEGPTSLALLAVGPVRAAQTRDPVSRTAAPVTTMIVSRTERRERGSAVRGW